MSQLAQQIGLAEPEVDGRRHARSRRLGIVDVRARRLRHSRRRASPGVPRVPRDAGEVRRRGVMDLRSSAAMAARRRNIERRASSSTNRIALDAGASRAADLEEQRKIEAVLVSHAHLDHVRDLATLADNRCQQGGPSLGSSGRPATLQVPEEALLQRPAVAGLHARSRHARGRRSRYRTLKPERPTAIVAG